MRTYALVIAFAAALFYPVPSSSQGIEIGPGGVHVDPDRYRYRYRDRDHYRDRNRYRRTRQDCKELRMACLHKDELGEQGEGNCQRYRETCGQ